MDSALLRLFKKVRLVVPGLFLVLMMFLMLATLYSYNYIFNSKVEFRNNSNTFIVDKGQDFTEIVSNLASLIKLDSPLILSLYARSNGFSKEIHAGEYEFNSNMTPIIILNKLKKGDVKRRKFTIVEGWNIYQLLDALKNDNNLVHKINNETYVSGLPMIKDSSEGAFFPDTYYYTYPDSDIDVLKMANGAMINYLNALKENNNCIDKEKDPYSILTLASLLEKEASDIEEMSLISGVINNRLRKNISLDIDASVRYGVKNFTKPILASELKELTPYNTYRLRGLPPTPIAMPSAAAILAACNPIDSDYFYYVSIDGKHHHFSKSLKEHNRAVHKYLR
ncbi:MAG: endolytic transglycosylase MltG [Legionellales bacterium]|jgi:UPF0755 protein|nr:endolytic transglycosylase MltG [Legionellales bacterium]